MLNGKEPNMKENQRLVQAGLNPAKELVTDGLSRRAETIRVEPKGERSQVAFLVDGMPYAGGKLTKPQGLAITQMLKLLSGLDIKVRNQPQSGGMKRNGMTCRMSWSSRPSHNKMAANF